MGRPATSENPTSFRLPRLAREALREISERLGVSQNAALGILLIEVRTLHQSGRFPRDSMLFTPALEKPKRASKAGL